MTARTRVKPNESFEAWHDRVNLGISEDLSRELYELRKEKSIELDKEERLSGIRASLTGYGKEWT